MRKDAGDHAVVSKIPCVDEGPVENILKPECFGLPLHCEFLCSLDDQDFTAAQCDNSVNPDSINYVDTESRASRFKLRYV
ncbi:hypothetical protein PAMP_017691 [Pampus punctatissimus]